MYGKWKYRVFEKKIVGKKYMFFYIHANNINAFINTAYSLEFGK